MATNRKIIEMMREIRGEDRDDAKTEGVYLAKVLSTTPLSIKMHGVTIQRGISLNPALLVSAGDMETPFAGGEIPAGLRTFLKSFHQAYVLKPGDEVFVCLSAGECYITGKAARA